MLTVRFQGRTYAERQNQDGGEGRNRVPSPHAEDAHWTLVGGPQPPWVTRYHGGAGGEGKSRSQVSLCLLEPPLSSWVPSKYRHCPWKPCRHRKERGERTVLAAGMSLRCGRVGNCLVFYHALSLGEPPGVPSLILCTWKPNALWRPPQLGWAQALPPTPIQGLFWRHGSWTKTPPPT